MAIGRIIDRSGHPDVHCKRYRGKKLYSRKTSDMYFFFSTANSVRCSYILGLGDLEGFADLSRTAQSIDQNEWLFIKSDMYAKTAKRLTCRVQPPIITFPNGIYGN